MATAVAPIVSDREWNAHILNQLAAGKLTQEQALAQLKTAPKAASNGRLSCKVSEKGAAERLRAPADARDAVRRAMGALVRLHGRNQGIHRPVQRPACPQAAELDEPLPYPSCV